MDANKEISSNISPAKSIFIGLLIGTVACYVITAIAGLSVIYALGIDIEGDLSGVSKLYIADILVSFLMFTTAGYISTKYVPGLEVKYGLILGKIILVIYVCLYYFGGAISYLPLWFIWSMLIGIVPCFYAGAKFQANT